MTKPIDLVYMQTALLHAGLSKAIRKKVGAVLVTKNSVVLTGYNGTPSGYSNECERKVWILNETSFGDMGEIVLETKPETLHAELNCLLKAAREGVSVVDSVLYVTLSPCIQCAAMLAQAGVKKVFYAEEYRCNDGILLLRECNVEVAHICLT